MAMKNEEQKEKRKEAKGSERGSERGHLPKASKRLLTAFWKLLEGVPFRFPFLTNIFQSPPKLYLCKSFFLQRKGGMLYLLMDLINLVAN